MRQSAAYRLTELQAKEAVPELIALLKDDTYGLRKSAAYALGQYESNILVSGLFLGLSYNDIFVKRKSLSVNGYYCNEEAEKKPRNYKNDQNDEIRNLAKIELEKLQFKMQKMS
jgi:HEAT repeat protein